MEHQVTYRCDDHQNPFDCPDNLVDYSEVFDEYGLIIHDGGASVSGIDFCPWCGTQLPASKRDKWFEELEALGFDDPGDQEIPTKYNSDEWYRS